MGKGCRAAVPGGDGAVQIGKDEVSGIAIAALHREGRGCIRDLAGGALRSASRCWNGDIAVGPRRGHFRDGGRRRSVAGPGSSREGPGRPGLSRVGSVKGQPPSSPPSPTAGRGRDDLPDMARGSGRPSAGYTSPSRLARDADKNEARSEGWSDQKPFSGWEGFFSSRPTSAFCVSCELG